VARTRRLALAIVCLLAAGCTGRSQQPAPVRRLARDGRRIPLLAFYYVWYGTPFGPSGTWAHWSKPTGGKTAPNGTDARRIATPPHLRDLAASAYPLIGPYDSRQREVVRWHIRLAKAAGIDGFLVSWWGPGGWQKPPGLTYKAFTEVLLPVAEEEGFKLALCDELPQFFDGLDQVIAWAAEYLDRFRKSPAYLHIDGQPVYYVYQVWQGKLSPDDGRRLIRAVEERVGDVYWIVDKMRCRLAKDSPNNRELFFPDDWLGIEEIDALGGYATFSNLRVHDAPSLRILYSRLAEQAHAHDRKVLLPVHPGLDNGKFNPKPYVMPRREGKTLRGFLDAALAADADLVAITSFNEWPETTVVEPSLSWPDPYLYLRIVAEYTGTRWSRPPLPPARVLDPLIQPRFQKER